MDKLSFVVKFKNDETAQYNKSEELFIHVYLYMYTLSIDTPGEYFFAEFQKIWESTGRY
jgi:hypothetical protein